MIVPQEIKTDPLIHKRINKKPVNLDSIEAITAETDRMVTGTFVNVECPGQPAKISAKLYKGQEYFSRVFKDGERATIPLSIARSINERCIYQKHGYIQDEKGNPIKTVESFPRYKFTAEF